MESIIKSKAWDWKEEKSSIWLEPSEESYFISARWKNREYKELLDFGCGLGRHSIYFSEQGFNVSAFDLSVEGTNHLQAWAEKDDFNIDVKIADMVELPYADNSFDCLFAYHVISHTDTIGANKILDEVNRVVKPHGEIYITLCSKETWSFVGAGYLKIDENTVRKTDDGPEKDIPHFYVNLDDVIRLFTDRNLELLRIRHIDDCYFDGEKKDSRHYFVLAKKMQG